MESIGMNAFALLKRFTAVALLFSLCSALLFLAPTRVQASGGNLSFQNKISPELRQLMQSGQNPRVNVIVQSNGSSGGGGLLGGLLSGLLASLVQAVGGVVHDVLSTLNITLVEVNVNSVNALVADP